MSLAATIEPLRAANRVAAQDLYAWRLFSQNAAPPVSSSGIPIQVEGALDPDAPRDALVVIAAFNARSHAVPVLARLRQAARLGVPLAGVESGSWVLAQAGLLDGHRATTHWEELEEFGAAFPNVEVVSDRYVLDRRRFTAGGAAPTLDMVLHMIREQHGLALALDVASIFVYDQRQEAGEPQPVVSLGRLATRDPAIAAAIRTMQSHLDEPLPVAVIARGLRLSVRTMQMRFRMQLGMSPHAYYLDLRLAAARRMLQQTGHGVAEVAAASGFASSSAFARAFRARFGKSPMEVQRQTFEGSLRSWRTRG